MCISRSEIKSLVLYSVSTVLVRMKYTRMHTLHLGSEILVSFQCSAYALNALIFAFKIGIVQCKDGKIHANNFKI